VANRICGACLLRSISEIKNLTYQNGAEQPAINYLVAEVPLTDATKKKMPALH